MSGAKLATALVLAAAAAAGHWRMRAAPPLAPLAWTARVPAALAGWASRDVELDERQYRLLETRDVLLRRYDGGGASVLACIAVAGVESKAAHPPEICYRGQGWRVEAECAWDVELAGRPRPVGELLLEKGGERLLVWSWYRVGGDETGSWWGEQWLALRARFSGGAAPAALLRFSTTLRAAADRADGGRAADPVAVARGELGRFLELFLVAADRALAGGAARGESRPPR